MAVNLSKEKQGHDNPVVMDFENMVEYHGDLVPKTRLEVFDNKDKKPICLTKPEDISCNTEVKKEAEPRKTNSKNREYSFLITIICIVIFLATIFGGLLYLVVNFEDISYSIYDIVMKIMGQSTTAPNPENVNKPDELIDIVSLGVKIAILVGMLISLVKQLFKMIDRASR